MSTECNLTRSQQKLCAGNGLVVPNCNLSFFSIVQLGSLSFRNNLQFEKFVET